MGVPGGQQSRLAGRDRVVTRFQGLDGGEADQGEGSDAVGGGDYATPAFLASPTSGRVAVTLCPERVLSIHFFGRSFVLNLWFPDHVEASAWQVRFGALMSPF